MERVCGVSACVCVGVWCGIGRMTVVVVYTDGTRNSGMGRWAAAQRVLGAVQYYVDAKQGREEREDRPA